MRREGSDWAKVRPLVAQRCRMKRVAGPVGDPQGLLGAEPCAPVSLPLLATKVDTPVRGDECPSDTWGPASSG